MQRMILTTLAVLGLAAQADEAVIRKTLAERYPGVTVQSVSPTAIPGLWEVWTGSQLVYTDAAAEYLIVGSLVETRSKTNISQQRMNTLRAVRFDSLPLDQAFTVVKGKGERRLAVFTDPDCPFCRRLERELDRIDNLTVHVFLYPLPELHPNAPEIARNVWCAADRAQSWRAYMLEGKAPDKTQDCEAPIQQIAELAARLGIGGTPALIFGDGRRVDGFIPAREIEALLKSGS
ncbi:MAG: DsbC family protein [Thiobacillaceae bacterium]